MAPTTKRTTRAGGGKGTSAKADDAPPRPVDGDPRTNAKGAARGHDPAYALPLIGPLIEQADRFRSQLPMGASWNKGEAEVLRAEAKALRAVANYLEARAKQLERLQRQAEGEKPRVRRVPVD